MDDTEIRAKIEAAVEAAANRVRERFERLGVTPTEETFGLACLDDPALQALMEDEEAKRVAVFDRIDEILDSLPPQQPTESLNDYERRCKAAIDADVQRGIDRQERLARLRA